MKRILSVVLVCLFVAGYSSLILAKGETAGNMEKKDMGCEKTEMHHMMTVKHIVATTDGGIIVLVGNKLQKYDKNLALVKEVEIKIDRDSMKKMMQHKMMQHKMMEGSK